MFIHDNGIVCVLAATRCGHTSMYGHFGMEPYTIEPEIWKFWSTTSRRIIILRHPYDRLNSALKFWEKVQNYNNDHVKIIMDHTDPYLIKLPRTMPIEIIDFYRLSEYIVDTKISTTTNANDADRNDVFKRLPSFVDKAAQRKEYEQYQYFMQHCKQISPEEWRELTCS